MRSRYRSLVESAQDPIFTSERAVAICSERRAAARLGTPTRDSRETWTNYSLSKWLHCREGSSSHTHCDTLIGEDFLRCGGSTCSEHGEPVRDPRGQIVAAQAIVRDITKLKQVEGAYARARALATRFRVAHRHLRSRPPHRHVSLSPWQRNLCLGTSTHRCSGRLLSPIESELRAWDNPRTGADSVGDPTLPRWGRGRSVRCRVPHPPR